LTLLLRCGELTFPALVPSFPLLNLLCLKVLFPFLMVVPLSRNAFIEEIGPRQTRDIFSSKLFFCYLSFFVFCLSPSGRSAMWSFRTVFPSALRPLLPAVRFRPLRSLTSGQPPLPLFFFPTPFLHLLSPHSPKSLSTPATSSPPDRSPAGCRSPLFWLLSADILVADFTEVFFLPPSSMLSHFGVGKQSLNSWREVPEYPQLSFLCLPLTCPLHMVMGSLLTVRLCAEVPEEVNYSLFLSSSLPSASATCGVAVYYIFLRRDGTDEGTKHRSGPILPPPLAACSFLLPIAGFSSKLRIRTQVAKAELQSVLTLCKRSSNCHPFPALSVCHHSGCAALQTPHRARQLGFPLFFPTLVYRV